MKDSKFDDKIYSNKNGLLKQESLNKDFLGISNALDSERKNYFLDDASNSNIHKHYFFGAQSNFPLNTNNNLHSFDIFQETNNMPLGG